MDGNGVISKVGSRFDRDRRDVVRESSQQLEDRADNLLAGLDGRLRTYTERQLARKIRLEDARMPVVEETGTPHEAVDYLFEEQLRLMVESSQLTKLQAAVFAFLMRGWVVEEVAIRFGMPLSRINRLIRSARRRIACGGSVYDGLFEVYWSEVHRYVYRRPAGR